jgi:hypothetical protein
VRLTDEQRQTAVDVLANLALRAGNMPAFVPAGTVRWLARWALEADAEARQGTYLRRVGAWESWRGSDRG